MNNKILNNNNDREDIKKLPINNITKYAKKSIQKYCHLKTIAAIAGLMSIFTCILSAIKEENFLNPEIH